MLKKAAVFTLLVVLTGVVKFWMVDVVKFREPLPFALFRNETKPAVTLWSKLKTLNENLEAARRRVPFNESFVDIRRNGSLDVISGKSSDLLRRLSAYPQVETVSLPWTATGGRFYPEKWNSLSDKDNVLIRNYYGWTAEPNLCRYLRLKRTLNDCRTFADESGKPISLNPKYERFYAINISRKLDTKTFQAARENSSFITTTFVSVVRNAFVTANGDVFSGNFKYVPVGCEPDLSRNIPGTSATRQVRTEVFVIAQSWGTRVFHEMIEVLPRLVPYLDFLHRNPSIPILLPAGGYRLTALLEILGLDRKRFISGTVATKVAYVPQATACGAASVQSIQLLSSILRGRIRQTFGGRPSRDKLVLVRRSGHRRFRNQNGIEKILRRVAADFNLTFALFPDNPVPSLNDTMKMFNAAVLVVGTSGAGLSNIVFSEPGSYVVEGVCNPPHVNLTLMHLSHVLGHRWHGVMARAGCKEVVDVNLEDVDRVVRQHLRSWKRASQNKTELDSDIFSYQFVKQ